MIIAISGSVGSGKTTIAKQIAENLNAELIELNKIAEEFKLNEVKELQTFDFDIDKLVARVNRELSEFSSSKKVVVEGHFAHFLNPDVIDILFVINRDLKELKIEYKNRDYNEQKIKDNLEVESFNLCFYEALEEGYKEEEQVFCVKNDKSLNEIVQEIEDLIDE